MVSGSQRFSGDMPDNDEADEVANDAMQLLVIAIFNGFCRLTEALAHNGLLLPDQLRNIHDLVTEPLDDPDWRDDSFIAGTRDTIEKVLAAALREVSALTKR
jgi:hypothetical protein